MSMKKKGQGNKGKLAIYALGMIQIVIKLNNK